MGVLEPHVLVLVRGGIIISRSKVWYRHALTMLVHSLLVSYRLQRHLHRTQGNMRIATVIPRDVDSIRVEILLAHHLGFTTVIVYIHGHFGFPARTIRALLLRD